MIALRTFFKSTSTRKPRASKARPSEPTGDLVRGNESLHAGVETVGSDLVGGRARKRTVGEVVPAKSTVGSDSLGTEPDAEPDCGA